MMAVWLMVLSVFALQAQAALREEIKQTTEGWCSPAVAKTDGNVTVNCLLQLWVLSPMDQNSARAQKAKQYIEEGKLEEAGKIIFAKYYNAAKQNREKENYLQAIEYYKGALLINPDHFGANYNLADSYRKIGNTKDALAAFEKAVEISPNNAETYYNMANLYQQNGEFNKAKKYYQKVIELEPEGSKLSQRAKKNLMILDK